MMDLFPLPHLVRDKPLQCTIFSEGESIWGVNPRYHVSSTRGESRETSLKSSYIPPLLRCFKHRMIFTHSRCCSIDGKKGRTRCFSNYERYVCGAPILIPMHACGGSVQQPYVLTYYAIARPCGLMSWSHRHN